MFKRTLLAAAVAAVPFTVQAEQSSEDLQKQIDILAQEIESLKESGSSASGNALDKLSIGGYGELHYNKYLENDNNDQIDAHRFVLYFGYDYNDKVRFFSEFELEHSLAGDGKPGEVELEQAYIQIDTTANTKLTLGQFLVPVGILNETHEPDTFYGVERNNLESKIVPATWWEAGAMFSQDIGGGLSYDIAGHSGLNMFTAGGAPNKIRSGRQKVAEANGNKGAMTGRVRYVGLPGLDLAASVQYQQDVFQDAPGIDSVSGVLVEAHARYTLGRATFTVQHAAWEFDDEIGVEAAEEQSGLMAEASYKLTDKFGVFARHTDLDWNDGGADPENTERTDSTAGVNYWIVPNVVVKADYTDVEYDTDNKDDDADDNVSVGIGWSF